MGCYASKGVCIRRQILRSDAYIRDRSWIFDLEEALVNCEMGSESAENIFRGLSRSPWPFFVFDAPTDFRRSGLPVDLIIGLYSDEKTDADVFVSDIFMGRYHLLPCTPHPLDRFLLRFVFYGSDVRIDCPHEVRLICCILDNSFRRECVLQSIG